MLIFVMIAGGALSYGQEAAPIETPASSPTATPAPLGGVNPAFVPQAANVQVASANGGPPTSAVPLLLNSPCLFSPVVLSVQPQLATFTLTYNVAYAGASVLVAPLDGGLINGAGGGQSMTVGPNGTIVFSFQAPASPGRYHVITNLGGTEIALPFIVPATPISPVTIQTPIGN
jgi:hypothetical protein